MRKIILLSGGMDSLISYRLFHPDATPVFVHTGSRYARHDYRMAMSQEPDVRLMFLPELREWANGVVPHRNAVLLSAVANMYDAEQIVVSAPRGELIWDQQRRFHRTMEKALRGVRILNPLRHLTKTQAVAAWMRAGHDSFELLFRSRSCYSDKPGQCGECPACVKRWVAITNNGLQEEYRADVRQHAMKLGKMGTVGDLLRYGARPAWEAWRAVREP